MMTLGSLFSGSGSFELAGAQNGIVPVFASEVEPYAIAVTTSRFPKMQHLGNVTEIHGDQIPSVDVLTFGSPCFTAGTLILTDSGYKPIEDVKIGDRCLTHRNHWKKVVAIGHRDAPTVLMKGNHYGLNCTPEHPFYIGGEQWERAQNMQGLKWAVPCTVAPLPIPEMRNMGARFNPPPRIDSDLMYVCGRWLADGWIRNTQRSQRPKGQKNHQIIICANDEKTPVLLERMRRVFPNVAVLRDRTCNKLRVHNAPLVEWILENFGKGAMNKRLPAWIYGADYVLREALLRGYFDGDGDWKQLRATSVSKQLAHGIRLLGECTLDNVTGTIFRQERAPTCIIEGRVCRQHSTYTCQFYSAHQRTVPASEGKHWYRVRSVEPAGFDTVYNIEVEDDHSYIAEGIVVHNCQDVSVAGKQVGLHEGKRSSLFFEAIRIIQEMRCATHGKYPKFAVFENVPGLFSSARGADFRVVQQAFVSLCDDYVLVPEPPKGKWLHAGEIVGDHYSLAWRVQGAEHWGVPQRRNRIYLVVDFTARRAGKVLFEQTGLRRDSPACRTPGQGTAADVEGSAAGSAGKLSSHCVCNESGQGYWMPGFRCLRAEGENRPSRPGHLVCFVQNQRDEVRDLGECSGALAANAGMKQQSYLAYALQGNGIDRADTAGCNGCGWKANVSYTLNTIDRHAVCYQDTVGALCAADWRGPNSQYVGADKLICTDARGNGNGQVCANVTGDHENRVTDYTNIITYGGDKAGTLDASYYKGAGARNGKEREFIAERKADRKYIVRRLSTTECARLQGQPDCWAIPVRKEDMTDEEAVFWEKVRETHAGINGTRYKPFSKREQLVRWYNRLHTDSAEYKLYGNGIALPCAVYVLRGVAQALSEEEHK